MPMTTNSDGALLKFQGNQQELVMNGDEYTISIALALGTFEATAIPRILRRGHSYSIAEIRLQLDGEDD